MLSIAGAIALAFAGPLTHSTTSAQSQTTTVLISPSDTFISLNTTSYSGAPTLGVYTWPNYQVANAILMKFNLSGLPAGAVIQSARIRLALVEADNRNGATYTVTAHKITGRNPDIATANGSMATASAAWAPSTCCYNNIPLAQSNISPAYATVSVDKTLGVKWFTITNMVQEWIATPSSNFGVLLNADSTALKDKYRYFASMENPDTSLRPALEVTVVSSDVTPPSVSVTSPASGATLAGTVAVNASAQDASGVAGVQFRLNGNALGSEDTSAPYSINWNTTTVADGNYTLTAVARDARGNTATSAGVGVTVRNVSGGSGGSGGSSSSIVIFPTDTSINLDSNNYSTLPTLSTYTWPDNQVANAIVMKFDLSSLPAGSVVQDATLNMALVESDTAAEPTYTITAHKIINRNPNLASATGYTYNGSSAWTASGCCYSGIPLAQSDITTAYDTKAIDKAAGYKTWSLTRMVQEWQANPSSNFGVLLNSDATKLRDRYRYFASAENANTNLRPFLRVTLGSGSGSTGGGGTTDTTAPSVSVTSPAGGSTVSGTSVSIAANATDNVGVTGVQFRLDGNNLGSEDTTAPFAMTWNTTGAANGTHSLTAVARDAAGNQRTSTAVSVNVSNAAPTPPPPPPPSGGSSGIAAMFPGDVGIENHPSVIFTEQFEEGTIASMLSRWGDVLSGNTMQFTSDVPSRSASGSRALSIPSTASNPGGHLYKILSPGVNDTIYVRWYIKYSTAGTLHHSGIWVGGYNPLSGWPDPQAGNRPNGDDRFAAAAEQNEIVPGFDHYNYWMGMRPDGAGDYWGNFLLNDTSVQVQRGQWACVEQMIKLNNPTSSYNGEHAIWLNGVKISHLGQGFPRGRWSGGRFIQDPNGTPFEGFRWRTTTDLNINYLWLQNYTDTGVNTQMLFDHVVVSTSYIGCMP